MDIKIYSKWGELPIINSYQDPPAELLLPGAEIKMAEDLKKGYCFLFQEFETPQLSVRFCNLVCHERDSVTIVTEPGITFRIAINRSHQFVFKYLGKQLFHQPQYNLFFDPHSSADYLFNAGDLFGFIDIVLKPEFCRTLAGRFTILEDFLKSVEIKLAAKLFVHNQVAPIEVIRWYQELEAWGYMVDKDNKDGEYLAQMLITESFSVIKPHPEKRPLKLTQAEVNCIYDIEELIYNEGLILSTEELAHLFKISPYKLENGFKQIFGHSLLKHVFEEKMLIALRIVQDKRYNSKQVANLLGYSNPQSFLRAFKNRFGYPYR